MNLHSLLILTLLASAAASIAGPQQYSRIRIEVLDGALLSRIAEAGVDFEGVSGRVGGPMEFIVGPHEVRELSAAGIPFTVIQRDLSTATLKGLSRVPANALGFGVGSMGGYYTFSEVLRQLDSMKLRYPTLVRARDSIGSSTEGRGIWAVKISDNPNTDESDEGEALYTGLHHAREPEGMMTVIYYMWWLLEHYGNDSLATYLVNNRQMWFIPVVNPDGYVYNELTNPGGGGFWRKNRRVNAGGSFGVDLNRNYGPFEMWNAPNGGSSDAPGSDTYRGTAPFSEPEDMAIAAFLGVHAFRTCLNYHTFGNYLIFPWGYLSRENDDSLIYREFAFDMVRTNRHTSGTDQQTVGYSTRGNSDDYMYGDLSKPQTFAMTPEVGYGFWPATSDILPLAQKNLEPNVYASLVAGQYTVLKHIAVLDGNSDGDLMTGESFSVKALFRNKGLGNASGLQATITSASPSISFTTSAVTIGPLAARGEHEVTFSGTASSYGPLGTPIALFLTLRTPDGYVHRDTASIILGAAIPLLSENGDLGLLHWTTGGGWSTTSTAHIPPVGFTDSPTGAYAPATENSLTTSVPVDLDGYGYAVLKFWTKWAIEPSSDFAIVEASSDGGTTWMGLRSSLSHEGSGLGKQVGATWGYDGYTPGMDWVEQEMDLSSFLGNPQVLLRFRLSADSFDERDGWYLDDIRVLAFNSTVQFSSVTVRDQGQASEQLFFGESLFATDGIDPLLNENDLGPKPSAGTFDARWAIDATNGTRLDMRDTVASPSSTNVFTLEFQPGTGGYPLTVAWDPRGFLPGGWHIRDGVTHGALFDVSMWGDTLLTVTNPAVHSVELVHSFADSIPCLVGGGWNLVSLPVVTNDRSKSTLFAAALTPAFMFQGSYVVSDTLSIGKGYWVKYPAPGMLSFRGIPVVQETLVVPSGWSLAGGVSVPLRDNQIERTPPANIFTFRGGRYNLLNASSGPLRPGEGFWIKGPTTAILSPFTPIGRASVGGQSHGPPNRLTITDAEGNSSDLCFGLTTDPHASGQVPELPPVSPVGTFDARFASNRLTELFSLVGERHPAEIRLQASAYPVTIRWRIPATSQAGYRLEGGSAEGDIFSRQLVTGEGSMQLAGPVTRPLKLSAGGSRSLPQEIGLSQNFPNPFNPSTTVEVVLPVPARVTLSVLNLLGEELLTPLRQELFPAGRFQETLDGTLLPSGVYFYRLDVAPLSGEAGRRMTNKMTLIK